jgi:hypothetical protein
MKLTINVNYISVIKEKMSQHWRKEEIHFAMRNVGIICIFCHVAWMNLWNEMFDVGWS